MEIKIKVVLNLVVYNVPDQQKESSSMKLGHAYVPYQQYRNLYPVDQALYKGTIFVELYQPEYYQDKIKKIMT
jgi:Spore coat associated protein JA (CotJA)